jgi:hypothetical protein
MLKDKVATWNVCMKKHRTTIHTKIGTFVAIISAPTYVLFNFTSIQNYLFKPELAPAPTANVSPRVPSKPTPRASGNDRQQQKKPDDIARTPTGESGSHSTFQGANNCPDSFNSCNSVINNFPPNSNKKPGIQTLDSQASSPPLSQQNSNTKKIASIKVPKPKSEIEQKPQQSNTPPNDENAKPVIPVKQPAPQATPLYISAIPTIPPSPTTPLANQSCRNIECGDITHSASINNYGITRSASSDHYGTVPYGADKSESSSYNQTYGADKSESSSYNQNYYEVSYISNKNEVRY